MILESRQAEQTFDHRGAVAPHRAKAVDRLVLQPLGFLGLPLLAAELFEDFLQALDNGTRVV